MLQIARVGWSGSLKNGRNDQPSDQRLPGRPLLFYAWIVGLRRDSSYTRRLFY